MTPRDPFIDLWQSAPKPDTQDVLRDLERVNRLHRRFNQTLLAILTGTAVLLLFEESTGRLATHGALSAVWILSLVFGAAWRQRTRCHRTDALSLGTVRLLEFLISRAARDLFLARCLYAGAPCSAAATFLLLRTGGATIPGPLHLIQTIAGVAALLAMVTAGALLARSRSAQVRELRDKLRAIQREA
jgi:hypothetical protein